MLLDDRAYADSLSAALERDALHTDARLALACAYIRMRMWRDADEQASLVLRNTPDHLEAHLLRGMARRELERSLPLSWSNLRDFEFVVERDSAHADVLYEYAVALQYRESGRQQRKAMTLAERQIALKPKLLEPRLGIFDLYRYYVRTNDADDVLEWLQGRDSHYARFFTAEVHRREGRLATAEADLGALLDDAGLQIPRIPIWLALARIRYEQERDAEGETLVRRAVESIDEPLDAYLLFRDLKYVLSPAEYALFQRLVSPDEMRDFLEGVFEKRDPMPASDVNARLAEHYRRLILAERHYVYFGARNWVRNPDKYRRLDFPTTFDLASEFDDRGVIYIRHGEPDDRAAIMGIEEYGESWHYERLGLDFHFRTHNNMSPRLQPLPDPELLDDVDIWDGSYRQLARDWDLVSESLIRESIDKVTTGLTTDHFTWDEAAEPIDMPVMTALFRGENDKDELYVIYALPAGELSRGVDNEMIDVEVGIALHDTSWRSVDEAVYTKRIPRTDDLTSAAIDLIRAQIAPGGYHVSLHAREPIGHRVAAVKTDLSTRSYGEADLGISDIVPAFDARPATGSEPHVRHGVAFRANPILSFRRRRPMYAYFEIYNLTYGSDERTHYSIEYRLESRERHGKFLGLFGGDKITLAIEASGEGSDRMAVEYGQIDVSKVPEDVYELTVTVTDETIGRSVSRSRTIRLTD